MIGSSLRVLVHVDCHRGWLKGRRFFNGGLWGHIHVLLHAKFFDRLEGVVVTSARVRTGFYFHYVFPAQVTWINITLLVLVAVRLNISFY